jgi:hypothetical protein
MTDAEEFRWVSEEQERYLEDSSTSAWQREWPEYLGRYLDYTWSGWRQEDDDRRREWLDERIETIALGWLSDDQRNQLYSLASERGDWQEWLPQQLDQWWPDWAKAAPDALSTWFESALPGLLPPSDPVASSPLQADPRSLDWLTDGHRDQLDTLIASYGDWRQWLPTQMDQWWPDWVQADSAQLTTWFDGALQSLVQPSVADPGAASSPALGPEGIAEEGASGGGPATAETALVTEVEPTNLDWITEAQQTELEGLDPIRGDWRDWLPAELDSRWRDWRGSAPEHLTARLDTLLPLLTMPSDDGLVEHFLPEAMEQFQATLPSLAEDLGLSLGELEAEIAKLPDDFFANLVEEQIAAARPALR